MGESRRKWFLNRWLFGDGMDAGVEERKAKWPNKERLMLAWRLATSLEDLEALLLGHYVDPARLDQDWLRWAKREKMVALKPAIETL